MKTIVISGACSNVGKTTAAKKIARLLPGSRYIKIGHGKEKPGQTGEFFHTGTTFSDIFSKHGDAPFLIIESNTILNEITPDLLVYLTGDSQKSSAKKAEEQADLRRGERVDEKKVSDLVRSLSVEKSIVRKIAWISGARPSPATAIILAGDKSRWMRHDKAFLPIEKEPAIASVYQSLSEIFDDVIVVASGEKSCRFKGMKYVSCKMPEQGPLIGIVTGLKVSNSEINFITAWDIHELNISLIYDLFACSEDYDIVIPSFEKDFREPLFGVYKKSVIHVAERMLSEHRRSVDSIFSSVNTKILSVNNSNLKLFKNKSGK
jgi:molybdopterin-guanine dinucleotide biosynthesis protein A